jgi:hypothetical protein
VKKPNKKKKQGRSLAVGNYDFFHLLRRARDSAFSSLAGGVCSSRDPDRMALWSALLTNNRDAI